MAAFSDEEIAAAIDKHPGLVRTAPGEVEGELEIHAVYDGIAVRDRFRIRISKESPNSRRVPALREIGERTRAIALKWGKKRLADVHCNPDGTACVCVKQEEVAKFPEGADLPFFLDGLVRDYLYGLAFFDIYGRWPWGERSHGALGLLEFYAGNPDAQTPKDIEEVVALIRKGKDWKQYSKQLQRPRGDRACPCGSGKPFRTCHREAWAGLLWLRKEMDRLGMGSQPQETFNYLHFTRLQKCGTRHAKPPHERCVGGPMKLILRRDQKSTGIISKTVTFYLDVRADLTEDEKMHIAMYKLGDAVLYENATIEGGSGLLGIASRLAYKAVQISITVNDLEKGKRIDCKDIMEMLAIEEQVRVAAHNFKNVLSAAATFGGEEVIEIA